MSKDLWIAAHERLVAEYLDKHPEVDWGDAYERTAGQVDAALADEIAARIDSRE